MQPLLDQFLDFLSPLFKSEIKIGSGVSLTPVSVLVSLCILVVFHAFAKLLQRVLRARVMPRFAIDRATEFVILKLVHYLVMAVALLIVFGTLGFDLSSITVIAGLLSVGIGFGLQNLTANFVSGLILLFEAPIKVGDWIQVGDHLEGTVTSINLRYTSIETVDGIYILVPNQDLVTSQVINGSRGPQHVRIHTPVGVSYASDMKKVREILQTIADENPLVLKDPKPSVIWKCFGESSVDFVILTWIDNPKDKPAVQSALYEKAWWAFKEHGIEIPFPQRDLHLRSVSVPLPLQNIAKSDSRDPA